MSNPRPAAEQIGTHNRFLLPVPLEEGRPRNETPSSEDEQTSNSKPSSDVFRIDSDRGEVSESDLAAVDEFTKDIKERGGKSEIEFLRSKPTESLAEFSKGKQAETVLRGGFQEEARLRYREAQKEEARQEFYNSKWYCPDCDKGEYFPATLQQCRTPGCKNPRTRALMQTGQMHLESLETYLKWKELSPVSSPTGSLIF